MLKEEERWGYGLVFPALVYVGFFVGYPIIYSFFLALTDTRVGVPGSFIGLKNFLELIKKPVFHLTLFNSLLFTGGAVVCKSILGFILAFLLFKIPRGAKICRAIILIPWALPISMSTLSWVWMFDPTYSVINWILTRLGLSQQGLPWLYFPYYARMSIILANVWRGLPFFAITFLAGLTSIPPEILEAAKVDGAGLVSRIRYIIIPYLAPLLGIIILFSTMMTVSDFDLVWVLTRGGPMNSTHLLSTLAFQTGIMTGNTGMGAAISLFIVPILAGTGYLLLKRIRSAVR